MAVALPLVCDLLMIVPIMRSIRQSVQNGQFSTSLCSECVDVLVASHDQKRIERILLHIVARDQASHASRASKIEQDPLEQIQLSPAVAAMRYIAGGCAQKVWVRSILDASSSNSKQQNMMKSSKKACCLQPKDRMEAQEATPPEGTCIQYNWTLARSQGLGFTLVSNELRAHHPGSGSGSSDYAAEFGNDYYRLSAPAGLFGNVEGQGDTRPQCRLHG